MISRDPIRSVDGAPRHAHQALRHVLGHVEGTKLALHGREVQRHVRQWVVDLVDDAGRDRTQDPIAIFELDQALLELPVPVRELPEAARQVRAQRVELHHLPARDHVERREHPREEERNHHERGELGPMVPQLGAQPARLPSQRSYRRRRPRLVEPTVVQRTQPLTTTVPDRSFARRHRLERRTQRGCLAFGDRAKPADVGLDLGT
ncbi:MAG: hypothetical protein R3B99_18730 [Polyangiales bacterium]